MLCPRDQNELKSAEVHGTRIDRCDVCGGMYLEHGELNHVADATTGDLEFSSIEEDAYRPDSAEPVFACPRDAGVMMKKVAFVTYTNIILDYCDVCRGFWVDGRELVRINDEVRDLNEADRDIPDPVSVRLSRFFWSLPLPH